MPGPPADSMAGPSHMGGRTNVYRAVHGVLRERRNISPGTCCRRLRSAEVPSGRGPAGACCRSKGLCRGWDRPELRTEEQSGSIVAMGPQVHPSGVRTWVEEHGLEEGPADAWPAELLGGSVWSLLVGPCLQHPLYAPFSPGCPPPGRGRLAPTLLLPGPTMGRVGGCLERGVVLPWGGPGSYLGLGGPRHHPER
uniref:SCAN box domain-containing protein n=1 Tax=Oryzias sinensis TaxID=183150 RepID=A0A8C7XV10_9TELE